MRAVIRVSLLFVAGAMAQGVITGNRCVFNYTDASQTQWNYDLSSLKLPAGSDYRGFNLGYQYYANVCNSVNCGDDAPVAAVCQMRFASGQWEPYNDLGMYDGSNNAQWDVISSDSPQSGLKFVLTNGDNSCTGKMQTTTTIYLDCAPNAPDPRTVNMTVDQRGCNNFAFHIASPAACPTNPTPTPTPDDGNGGSGGLSGGSVFLIIFFVFSFVYVAGGCIYRRVSYGVNGMEACPNHEFWAGLPGLVADGGRYFVNTITCRGGGAGGSVTSQVTYDSMK